MKTLALSLGMSVAMHIAVFLGAWTHSPASYDVAAAPQCLELSLAAGSVSAPSASGRCQELPAQVSAQASLPAPQNSAPAVAAQPSLVAAQPSDTITSMPKSGSGGADAQTQGGIAGATGAAPVNGLCNYPPRYPAQARKMGYEGTVTLEVQVDAMGEATAVAIQQSCSHAILDNAALKALRQWRFRPATRFGIPVASTIFVPIVFRLEKS